MLKKLYGVIPQFLSREECDEIIRKSSELESHAGAIGNDLQVVDSYRKSDVKWIEDQDLKNKIMLKAHEINGIMGWDFDIRYPENVQFTIYTEDQEYNWHVDSDLDTVGTGGRGAIEQDMVRKISIVIPLVDVADYEGGGFYLYNHSSNMKYKMNGNKGDLIVFPSFLLHKVAPVVSGTRMSLVCWINGPKFK